MYKYIIHFLQLILLKLPLQLLGIVILPLISYKYNLGQYPNWAIWFDDAKARLMRRGVDGVKEFGQGHVDLFNKYNSTWQGRYIWSAFRNACNYFQHYVLGKDHFEPDAWLIQRDGLIRIRIGYKLGDSYEYRKGRELLGLPAQWVFSIGIRL